MHQNRESSPDALRSAVEPYVPPRIVTLTAREVLESMGAPVASIYDRVETLAFA